MPCIVDLYHEYTITTLQVKQGLNPSADNYRKVFQEICADTQHELFVAEEGGRVVGSVILLIVPNLSHNATHWALVENLVVTGGHRRRGTGRMLLEHVIAAPEKRAATGLSYAATRGGSKRTGYTVQ